MSRSLMEISKQLSKCDIKHDVAVGMAVRSYKYEGPILKDVHAIAQLIKRSLKEVPKYYQNWGTKAAPAYEGTLADLGASPELVKRYGNAKIVIKAGARGQRGAKSDTAMGMFYPTQNALIFNYIPDLVDIHTLDFRTAMRGLSEVIEHEVRHLVDYQTGLHKTAMDNIGSGTRDGSFSEYYNSEHELDARLTALFLSVDSLFRGSAIMALRKHVDAMTKEHNELLKNKVGFLKWLKLYDYKKNFNSMDTRYMSPDMVIEADGKCLEFWEFLVEEYGMALRAVKSSDVTPERKAAWLALIESSKDKKEHESQIKKIAGN